MDDSNLSAQLYEVGSLILRALEFNAKCVIAAYNTDDADRKACMEHVDDVYDMFLLEMESVFGDDEEEEIDESEDDESEDESDEDDGEWCIYL